MNYGEVWDHTELISYEAHCYLADPPMTEKEYWWLVAEHLKLYFTEEGL